MHTYICVCMHVCMYVDEFSFKCMFVSFYFSTHICFNLRKEEDISAPMTFSICMYVCMYVYIHGEQVRDHYALFVQCAEGLEWLKAYKKGGF